MKKIVLLLGLVSILYSCNEKKSDTENNGTNTGNTKNDNTKKEDAAKPPLSDSAIMKAWMDFATPGPMHKWLEKSNGTWEGDMISFDNPSKPDTNKATEVQSSIMGGRYVITKFTSTMMGQPMEGMSTMGYDNTKKIFVSTWVDNFGSGIVQMSGTYDEAKKTLNMKGHQTDPVTGKDSDMRQEVVYTDDNHFTMHMYGTGPDGNEKKFMTGTLTRKK